MLSLPDPYDDDYEAVLAGFVRLSKEDQAKVLKRIGILGPDGKLAPAYTDDDPDEADDAANSTQ